MIFLRLLALLAVGLVLILPALVLAESRHGSMPGWLAIGVQAGLMASALCFLFVAWYGDHMRRSPQFRLLGGLLLLIPAVGGMLMLATGKDPAMLWGSGLLLSFTAMLFISFVFPPSAARQRPMRERERERERGEPVLVVIRNEASR